MWRGRSLLCPSRGESAATEDGWGRQGEWEETDRVFVRVASPEEWRAREEESRESGGMETSGGVCAGRRGIAREREEEKRWCVSLWRESRPIADCVRVCRESVWYLGERRVCRGRESSGTPHNERNRTERERQAQTDSGRACGSCGTERGAEGARLERVGLRGKRVPSRYRVVWRGGRVDSRAAESVEREVMGI